MAFLITGHKPGLAGAFVRTDAHTAADALRFAREWAEQGVRGNDSSHSSLEAASLRRNARLPLQASSG
jgi:hypothetical protein